MSASSGWTYYIMCEDISDLLVEGKLLAIKAITGQRYVSLFILQGCIFAGLKSELCDATWQRRKEDIWKCFFSHFCVFLSSHLSMLSEMYLYLSLPLSLTDRLHMMRCARGKCVPKMFVDAFFFSCCYLSFRQSIHIFMKTIARFVNFLYRFVATSCRSRNLKKAAAT